MGGIVDQMTNFELSVAPGYMDNYTGSQFLPHTEAKTLFPEDLSQAPGGGQGGGESRQLART